MWKIVKKRKPQSIDLGKITNLEDLFITFKTGKDGKTKMSASMNDGDDIDQPKTT